jgi:capsular exopolysaccharide synthesis family protein
MAEADKVRAIIAGRNVTAIPSTYTVYTESGEAARARLQHCLSVLKRYRWRICVFITICVAATGLVSARLTPVYEAAATIDIDRQVPSGVLGQDAAQFPLGDADHFLATQLKLIQSDSVLRPVAQSFHLPVQAEDRRYGSRVSGRPGPDAPVQLRGLRVTRIPNTYLLQIRYRSWDPRVAADVANAIVNSYVHHTYTIRYNASVSLSAFMETQLAELKAKMERSSVALSQFERELNVINPEEKTSILSARLLQLNTEYTNAQSDRVRKQAAYNSVKNGSSEAAQLSAQGDTLRRISERLGQAEEKFAQVKEHYGVNHPEYRRTQAQVAQMQSELDAARQSLIRGVEVEYREAADRENILKEAVAQNKAELDRLNARSFQYQTLKRDAETDRKLYEELTRKIKEAGINAAFHNTAIRLADPARPPLDPVFPKLPLNLLLAFLCSGIVATGAAFIADALNVSVRDPKRMARLLNADVIGTLPFVKPQRRISGGLMLPPVITAESRAMAPAGGPLDAFNDAISVLLNSILLGSGERRLRSILISSAFPKEGKTTIATHLAAAHARQKRRTLLIDGDMRCPGVSTLLNVGDKKGFSKALKNGMDWRAELIHAPSLAELDILAAGPDPRSGADLIGAGLSRILEQANEYELVVVDTPPLFGFPEPLQMAAAVDGVVIVALAGRTGEEALQSLLGMLHRIRANVLGVVLNEARQSDGYPSRYYGYAQKRHDYAAHDPHAT